jgi:hypothetical protein
MSGLILPWCSWCNCYHSAKAGHIARHKYVLLSPGDAHVLFKSRAMARRAGYGQYRVLKVEVRPL